MLRLADLSGTMEKDAGKALEAIVARRGLARI